MQKRQRRHEMTQGNEDAFGHGVKKRFWAESSQEKIHCTIFVFYDRHTRLCLQCDNRIAHHSLKWCYAIKEKNSVLCTILVYVYSCFR
jgi:hypothetical protein